MHAVQVYLNPVIGYHKNTTLSREGEVHKTLTNRHVRTWPSGTGIELAIRHPERQSAVRNSRCINTATDSLHSSSCTTTSAWQRQPAAASTHSRTDLA